MAAFILVRFLEFLHSSFRWPGGIWKWVYRTCVSEGSMKIWKNLVKTECCSHEESTSLNFRQLFGNFRRHSLKYQDGLSKRSSSMRFAFNKLPQSHQTNWDHFNGHIFLAVSRHRPCKAPSFWDPPAVFGLLLGASTPTASSTEETPCKRLSRTKTCAVRAGRYILTSIGRKIGIMVYEIIPIWWFPKIGVPQNGWFIMENPIKMDDLGYHYFRKHPYIWVVMSSQNQKNETTFWALFSVLTCYGFGIGNEINLLNCLGSM